MVDSTVAMLAVAGSKNLIRVELAGVAQLARASAFQAEGRGFESRFPLQFSTNAHIAQEVEHFLGKEEVSGSSPDVGSIFFRST